VYIFAKRMVYRLAEKRRYENIQLISGTRRAPEFFALVSAALDLIKTVDARRFRRITSHFKIIENVVSLYGAYYDHRLKSCAIDYEMFAKAGDREFIVKDLACTLVHESMHAVLRRKGFSTAERRRGRIERICVREEMYFARRLNDPQHDWEEERRRRLEAVSKMPPERMTFREFRSILSAIWKS
jgi:hypothetical protein